jgi:hypothetical protein
MVPKIILLIMVSLSGLIAQGCGTIPFRMEGCLGSPEQMKECCDQKVRTGLYPGVKTNLKLIEKISGYDKPTSLKLIGYTIFVAAIPVDAAIDTVFLPLDFIVTRQDTCEEPRNSSDGRDENK